MVYWNNINPSQAHHLHDQGVQVSEGGGWFHHPNLNLDPHLRLDSSLCKAQFHLTLMIIPNIGKVSRAPLWIWSPTRGRLSGLYTTPLSRVRPGLCQCNTDWWWSPQYICLDSSHFLSVFLNILILILLLELFHIYVLFSWFMRRVLVIWNNVDSDSESEMI